MEEQDLNPNLLANMIRQRSVMNALGNGGLPQPMPESPQAPDLTVHHLHGTMPVTPQAQQAIAPEAPVPKVGPIDPNSANPAESAYKQALMNEPMRGDYHPSTKRKVLSALAGGAVGFFGGPQAGMAVHESLRNGPYDEQHQDWSQFAGNREKLATEEAAGTASAGKEALTAAQIAEQNALAKKNLNDSTEYKPVNQADRIAIEQGRLKVDTREAKMTDGSIKHLVQRNGLFYDPETNARVDRGAIEDISDEGKSLKATKQSRITGNLGASIQAKKIISAGVGGKTEDGITVDQPTFDAAKEFDAKLAKGDEPTAAFASIVKTMEEEKGRKLTSSEKIKLDNSLRPPIGPTILGPADTTGSRPVLPLRPGMSVPAGSQTPSGVSQENTDTAPTRQMAETAPHVISLLDKIDKQIDENVSKLGPAKGRWSEFMTGEVGTKDPAFAKLRTNVALAKTLIMRAHLGSRGGAAMYEHFNNLLDLAGSDPENLKAATGEIRNYMSDIAKSSHSNSNAPTQATKRYNPATGQIEDVK